MDGIDVPAAIAAIGLAVALNLGVVAATLWLRLRS
jgi:hypothetical protein